MNTTTAMVEKPEHSPHWSRRTSQAHEALLNICELKLREMNGHERPDRIQPDQKTTPIPDSSSKQRRCAVTYSTDRIPQIRSPGIEVLNKIDSIEIL